MSLTLREQAIRLRRWERALLVGALIAVLVVYFFIARPARKSLAALQSQAAAVRRELAQKPARSIDPRSAETIAVLQNRLRRSPRLNDSRESEGFLRDLVQACEQACLRRVTARSGTARSVDALFEMPVVMRFQGDFLDVSSFLRQIDAFPYLTRVRNVQLRATGEKAGEVEARLSLKAYSSLE